MAHIAEAAGRYSDMVAFVKMLICSKKERSDYISLTNEERMLLTIAYKSVSSEKRKTLRALFSSLYHKDLLDVNDYQSIIDEINEFIDKVKKELFFVCEEVIQICENLVEHPTICIEDKVYYFKLMGDYYRYIAEFSSANEEKEAVTEKASQCYENATVTAINGKLSHSSACMLGLALNHSVFYYEIVGDVQKV